MTELALTRSKAKHPPSKTVVEAERVKGKVEKSNTKRRQKNMAIRTRLEDLPPLARKYVEEHEGGMLLTATEDRSVTPEEMRDLEGQVGELRREREAEKEARTAADVYEKAERRMRSENIAYSSAVRRVVADDGHFPAREEQADGGESLAEAVERRMHEDKENYVD